MKTKIISSNRKAYHNFSITQTWEAGISLQGTEVKALRTGKINLSDGWVDVDNGQVYLKEVHIGLYSHGNRENHAEKRVRKLLMHKKEIERLETFIAQRGFSLVPTKIYFKDALVKVEVGLGKGKKMHDKRESSKEKDANRQIDRALKKSFNKSLNT